MKVFIIPTPTTEHLVKKLKKQERLAEVVFPKKNKEKSRLFPDGEAYIRIPQANKLKKGRVVVLHSGSPRPNEGLVELEMILQILKDDKVAPEVFFTYFPYGQQDKIFMEGEINMAESLIRKLVHYYGVRKIYVIDPHFGKEKWLKKYPVASLSAVPLLVKKAKGDLGNNILFLSPDKGGKRRTGICGVKKERIDSFRVEMSSHEINIKNETVAVVDDIIETGGTLLRFNDYIKKCGAKKIIVLATHGVLKSGVEKTKKTFSRLYLTNTINQKEANIDISDLILKNILKK
jgi:ribose-phosphate pyrophosphokinase